MGADVAGIALTIHPHPHPLRTVGMAAEAFEGTIADLYLPKRWYSRATGQSIRSLPLRRHLRLLGPPVRNRLRRPNGRRWGAGH
jgi:hypothetical protein